MRQRRIFTSLLCLLLVLGALSAFSLADTLAEEKPQNVLLITIDTLRADKLSSYNDLHDLTPNIDSLADSGVLFSRAFSNTSTTLPSHTNILLGTSPLYHGVHDNLNFKVRDEYLTLAEHLKANGYETSAYVGAYPLEARFGLDQGFDIYNADFPHDYRSDLSSLERLAEEVVDQACEGIKTAKSPWFVWIHCYDPHLPYDPPEPFKTRFSANPYDGEVAYVDFVMGKLLKCLEDENIFEETMIVFTGDHGESLGQHGELSHGFFAYNSSIWVPFIMKIPGLSPNKIEQNVSHLDIFPTICDVAGISKPSFLQGDSLLPVMERKKLSDRTIYFESMNPFYSHGWAPLMGFIQNNDKFIESPIPELYDLEKDFDELTNLAGQQKLDNFRKQLEEIILDFSSAGSAGAKENPDAETVEKLKSLGYISSSSGSENTSFGPDDDIKTLLPIHTQNYKAIGLHEEGRTEEAKEIFRNLLKDNHNIGMTYVYYSSVLSDEGKIEESLNILNEGLSHFPDMYEIYKQYIIALGTAKKFDEITAVFNEKIHREISVDPEIWNHVGFAYGTQENWESAIAAFKRAVSLDPRYAEALFNLGEASLSLAIKNRDQNLVDKAAESFKTAIDVDPEYANPYFSLGKIYSQSDNLDGAIYCWEKAVEIEPNFDQAIFYLGEAYLAKGEKDKALEKFLYIKENFFHRYPEELKKRVEDLIKRSRY
ncbi:sulfatase-like hydrolase/transferase [Acidobacteriota bacterium]